MSDEQDVTSAGIGEATDAIRGGGGGSSGVSTARLTLAESETVERASNELNDMSLRTTFGPSRIPTSPRPTSAPIGGSRIRPTSCSQVPVQYCILTLAQTWVP
eukprot:1203180-Pyramimonas_sp.AAC.2